MRVIGRCGTALAGALAVLLAGAARGEDAQHYRIDPKQSTLTFKAFKDGLLSGFAHDHTIAARNFSGEMAWRGTSEASSVTLTVKTAWLEVLDPKADAKDKAEIAKTMKSDEVLDVEKFKEMRFESMSMKQKGGWVGGGEGSSGALEITGNLTLHGVTRAITFLANAKVAYTGGPQVANGTIRLKQSDFGITPYSAGLGTLKVKDEVALEFHIVATR
jgi:polyisoprenoid-binding protein YceI